MGGDGGGWVVMTKIVAHTRTHTHPSNSVCSKRGGACVSPRPVMGSQPCSNGRKTANADSHTYKLLCVPCSPGCMRLLCTFTVSRFVRQILGVSGPIIKSKNMNRTRNDDKNKSENSIMIVTAELYPCTLSLSA